VWYGMWCTCIRTASCADGVHPGAASVQGCLCICDQSLMGEISDDSQELLRTVALCPCWPSSSSYGRYVHGLHTTLRLLGSLGQLQTSEFVDLPSVAIAFSADVHVQIICDCDSRILPNEELHHHHQSGSLRPYRMHHQHSHPSL